jgi:hypothetical protein
LPDGGWAGKFVASAGVVDLFAALNTATGKVIGQ